MDNSESLGLLAALREITELLAGLDLATLPDIGCVMVDSDFRDGGMRGKAQYFAHGASDLDVIHAIRTWAVALGGVVLLGDEKTHGFKPFRQIAAVLRLPSGVMFEVWSHLTELRPSPEWTAEHTGMTSIPLDLVS